MKRLFLTYIIIINAVFAYGQNFKILYLSSDSIMIGNRFLHAGNVFQASDVITWDKVDDMQNMTIQNQTTYVQKMVDRESLQGFSSLAEYENRINDKKSFLLTMFDSFKSFVEYYINADNHTSYRDGEKTEGMRCMEEILSQTYLLENRICIPTFIPITEGGEYILQTTIDGTEYSIPLIIENDCICITRNQLYSFLDNSKVEELKCRIIYKQDCQAYQLSDTMEIIFL